jgi:hypothetical protein
MTTGYPAFYGNLAFKQHLVAQIRAQEQTGNFVQNGGYWTNGKGCPLGFLLDGGQVRFESIRVATGLPHMVVLIIDDFFDCLPSEAAQGATGDAFETIAVSADLSSIFDKFCLWLLTDPTWGAAHWSDEPSVLEIAKLFTRALEGDVAPQEVWEAAREQALQARRSIGEDHIEGTPYRYRQRFAALALVAAESRIGIHYDALVKQGAWAWDWDGRGEAFVAAAHKEFLRLLEEAA